MSSGETPDNINQWIIKPTNSCQGKGIFIIDDISEVPIDEPCIISRYIHNPLLINGLKSDIRLYVLVTSALASGSAEQVTQAALDGGAQVIQLREKEMEGREFLALAERLRALTQAAGAIFVINDRVEIAALTGADGVHLGQGDILPLAARRILGPDAIIGLSTHAPDEAARAAVEGADYIGVGPIHLPG